MKGLLLICGILKTDKHYEKQAATLLPSMQKRQSIWRPKNELRERERERERRV
jgi:hypothetical protein